MNIHASFPRHPKLRCAIEVILAAAFFTALALFCAVTFTGCTWRPALVKNQQGSFSATGRQDSGIGQPVIVNGGLWYPVQASVHDAYFSRYPGDPTDGWTSQTDGTWLMRADMMDKYLAPK